jgi:hypothetical protein
MFSSSPKPGTDGRRWEMLFEDGLPCFLLPEPSISPMKL